MYFTLDDYRKIEQWLNKRGIKDTEFPDADTLNNKDYIPVIQDDRNKKLSVISFTRFLETMTGNLINVSSVFNKYGITLNEAINAIPVKSRRIGLIITFLNEDNEWVMYQFNSDTLNDWLNEDKWSKSYENAFKFKGLFTSEEELTDKVRKPLVGDYAFVGESMEEAELWICEEKGVWKNTFTKAHRYADLFEAVHSKDFNDFNVSQFIYDNDGEDIQVDEQYSDRAEKDALGNIIHFTYINREGFSEYVLDKILETITKVTLPEGSIGLEQLNEALRQYIKSGGNVINMADEEDLTIVNEMLKFRDKKYEPLQFSGKGRKFLRKNMADGINVLEQYLFDSPNTIYIIQYDYCLNGQTIEIPENSVLRFEGGSFNGGTIVLNNTKIEGEAFEIDVDEDEIQKVRSVSHVVNNTTFINMTFEGTYAVGQQLFHKSLKIPIWWNGSTWITQEWMSIDNINDWISSIEGKVDENRYEVETIHNDVTSIREDLIETVNNLNQLLNDNPTEAISNFNEIIKFLEGIEDTQSLDSIIKSLELQISHINTNIDNIIEGPINDLNNRIEEVNGNLEESLDNKVDKEEGKVLSSNDFRDDLAEKLDALPTEEELNDLLYEKANETSVNESLELKVDKVEGKQLSTEDFTTALKQKLEGLTNYNDEELSAKIDELKNALDVILDSENTTAVIDTWQEIEDFLAGITNAETLTGLLADLKSEITQLCADTYIKKSAGITLTKGYTGETPTYVGFRISDDLAQYAKGNGYLECYNGTHGWLNLKAGKYIVNGGTSSQFLKADGSVDGTAYVPANGNITIYGRKLFNQSIKFLLYISEAGGGIARGLYYTINETDTEVINGIGVYRGSSASTGEETNRYIYLGWGNSPWGLSTSLAVSDTIFTYKNNKVWHAGNDGAESGLDADLLDGKQPADLNVGSANKLTTKQLTNEDLNDIKDAGCIYYGNGSNTCTNKPDGVPWFSLQVFNSEGTYREQVLMRGGVTYRRYYNGSVWSPWKKMLTEDDIASLVSRIEALEAQLNN